MLGARGYKTKADIKKAMLSGKRLSYIETSLYGSEYVQPGDNILVGPCAYTKRTWYATVTVNEDGVITKVK